MELGDNRTMFTFEPVDVTPAPAEPVIEAPADMFDELVATLDVPDDVPALAEAAERRYA